MSVCTATNLPETVRQRLSEEYGQPTVRFTVRSTIGVYVMQLTSYGGEYEVGVYHWQDRPLDEARELTTIDVNQYSDYGQAYRRMNEALEKEFARGLQGYRFVKDEATVVTAYKYLKGQLSMSQTS